MRLAAPFWLILLLLVPVPWLLARTRPRVSWPTLEGFGRVRRRSSALLAVIPIALRGAAFACITFALARPQTVSGRTRIAGEGVGIVVALDQSSSMKTPEKPAGQGEPTLTRLDAAKQTLARFIAGRLDDPIGLVVFANYPDYACPATLDHGFLIDHLRAVRPARPGDDGTNLGDAMILSLAELQNVPTRKKALVLVTDGRNSPAVPDPTDPIQAARIARSLGITVYTIAVGQGETVDESVDPLTPRETTTEVEGPDLALLAELAKIGGGRAFEAADATALDRVFATIDALERGPVLGQIRTRYREHFGPLAVAALGLVMLDRAVSAGRLRRFP